MARSTVQLVCKRCHRDDVVIAPGRRVCNECRADQERARRKAKASEIRAKDRERAGRPKRKAQMREADRRRQGRPERKAQVQAAQKRYRTTHRERRNQEAQDRYWANPERFRRAARERERARRLRDPEAAHVRDKKYGHRKRARKRGAFVEWVDPVILFRRDEGCCGICGDPVDPTDFHIDHVYPLSRGGEHSYANTQVAHPSCNMRKGATIDE